MDRIEQKAPVIRRTYSYGPERNGVKLAIGCVVWTVVFYILLFIVGRYVDITAWFTGINAGYWILLAVCGVGSGISILCKTQKKLKISDTEVHYLYGVFSKQKVSIPISKVRSCKIGTSPLQRAFGTSTLSICTAGDNEEIYFEDIKCGEEAYRTIMDMIQ